jgi:hypothetical protein
MDSKAIAHLARIAAIFAAAVALLAGMFLGPRATVAVIAAILTVVFAAVSMVARRL